MAVKGLSIPVFGKYKNTDGVVTYTDGMINPHAVSYSITMEGGDNNPLYADNRVVENDVGRFSSGTISLETDDLTAETVQYLLGVKEIEVSYGEDKTVKTTVYDDEMQAPAVGYGIIEEHQINDINQYKAVILKKVIFGLPEDAATTRGETITWQTKTIEGAVSRSDEVNEQIVYPWKEEAWFSRESEALEYLKARLGVSA